MAVDVPVTTSIVRDFAHRVAIAPYSNENYDKFSREMNNIDAQAGPGLGIGRVLRFPFADSFAIYMVEKVGTRTVDVAWIALGDAWQHPFVEDAGRKVSRKMAEQSVRQSDRRRAL